MGKIKRVEIHFSNENGVFYSGQNVTGKVVAELTDSMKIRAVKLKFFGEVSVSFNDNTKSMKSHSEKEKYFEQVDILFGNAYIHRPWKFDDTTKKAFTLISNVDLNNESKAFTPGFAEAERKFSLTDRFMCCVRGGLSVQVKIPRCAYVPGEEILIDAEVNNMSTERVKRVEAYLQQNVIYKAKTGSRFDKGEQKIAQLTQGAVESGHTQVWHNEVVLVPSLPPSKLGGCKQICVDYLLNFIVYVEKAENILLTIPIVIGTVPLRNQNQPATPRPPALVTREPSAPPLDDAPEYIGPPPSYEECVYMDRGNIQDADDNQYTGGDRTYRPLYPIYATLPHFNNSSAQ